MLQLHCYTLYYTYVPPHALYGHTAHAATRAHARRAPRAEAEDACCPWPWRCRPLGPTAATAWLQLLLLLPTATAHCPAAATPTLLRQHAPHTRPSPTGQIGPSARLRSHL
jgi:hypothetical protein